MLQKHVIDDATIVCDECGKLFKIEEYPCEQNLVIPKKLSNAF